MSLLCKCCACSFELGASLCPVILAPCTRAPPEERWNHRKRIKQQVCSSTSGLGAGGGRKRLWESADSVKMLIISGTYVASKHGKEAHLVRSVILAPLWWLCCLLGLVLRAFRSLSLLSNTKVLKWKRDWKLDSHLSCYVRHTRGSGIKLHNNPHETLHFTGVGQPVIRGNL